MACRTRDDRLRFVLQDGETIEGRFWVKLISQDAFKQYMKHRGVTVRTLAARAGIKPAIVGHLRSGYRDTCSLDTATAIERALDAPSGSLFVAQVLHVVHGKKRAA